MVGEPGVERPWLCRDIVSEGPGQVKGLLSHSAGLFTGEVEDRS